MSKSYTAVLAGMKSRVETTPIIAALDACMHDIDAWMTDETTKDSARFELRALFASKTKKP